MIQKWLKHLFSYSLFISNIYCQEAKKVYWNDKVIDVPFTYVEILGNGKDKTTIIPERGYTVIQNPGTEFALLTPLHPCIGVLTKNLRTGISWHGHVHYSNSIDNVAQNIKKYLIENNEDAQNITVNLFSKKINTEIYNQKYRCFHQGKSQEQQMAYIKQTLIKHINCSDNQIDVRLFESEQDFGNTWYSFLDRSILVDGTDTNGKLNIYSASPWHLLGEPKPHALAHLNFNIAQSIFGWQMSPYLPNYIYDSYDSLKVIEVPKYTGAIIHMLGAKNPFNAVYQKYSFFNIAARIKFIWHHIHIACKRNPAIRKLFCKRSMIQTSPHLFNIFKKNSIIKI